MQVDVGGLPSFPRGLALGLTLKEAVDVGREMGSGGQDCRALGREGPSAAPALFLGLCPTGPVSL